MGDDSRVDKQQVTPPDSLTDMGDRVNGPLEGDHEGQRAC